MKHTFLIPIIFMVLIALTGCQDDSKSAYPAQPSVQVNIQPEQPDLSQSLDLKAVGILAQKSRNAEDLERKLNDPATQINNLDLDHNGKVNYINVQEKANGPNRVLELTTALADGTPVQLATIQIQATGTQQASMTLTGNQQYYPQNNYYQSHFSTSDLLLYAWLFAPHPMYYHPVYYYGHYPSYYRGYTPVSRSVYVSRTTTVVSKSPSASSFKSSTVATPAMPKASLSGANTSQKSFSQRDTTKAVGSGGFGGGSTNTVKPSSSSSPSRSSSSSSRSSFGSSRRR